MHQTILLASPKAISLFSSLIILTLFIFEEAMCLRKYGPYLSLRTLNIISEPVMLIPFPLPGTGVCVGI